MAKTKTKKPYTTATDLAVETNVSTVLAPKWGVTFHALPMGYRVGYSLTKSLSAKDPVKGEKIVSFVDIVRCNRKQMDYTSFAIDAAKIWTALNMSHNTGLPCSLVVQFDDCIAWVRLDENKGQFWYDVAGRDDRFEEGTTQPIAHIPINLFRVVKG